MRPRNSLKQEFLKKWMKGLQICGSSIKSTSLMERKKAIKLTADIAMASARKGATCWSRALIANTSKDNFNGGLVHRILCSIQSEQLPEIRKPSIKGSKTICHKKIVIRSKKTLKNRCGIKRKENVVAASITKRLYKKRTKVLKSLVPGGEYMDDEISLIQETLDYIVSLRTQVDVMRCLADAASANTNGQ